MWRCVRAPGMILGQAVQCSRPGSRCRGHPGGEFEMMEGSRRRRTEARRVAAGLQTRRISPYACMELTLWTPWRDE